MKVKKIFKAKKAGHGGTLDPIAEGILLIGLNKATKLFPFLSDLTKEYIFTAHLGITTDTYDKEGTVIEQKDVGHISRQMIEDIIPSFIGETMQSPPNFSAVKYKGMPLYEYARKGVIITPAQRKVKINKIEIQSIELPFVTLLVECSKGTYIRSICYDMGVMLGVGAHVTRLQRTRIGHFTIANSIRTDELLKSSRGIFNIEDTLCHLPSLRLSRELVRHSKNGGALRMSEVDLRIDSHDKLVKNSYIKLLDEGLETFAIGEVRGNVIKIKRVL